MKALDTWHKTRTGLFVFAIVELLLAYGAASWAIDSGNLFGYVLTLLLLGGSVQNFVKLIISLIHGNRSKTSKA
ncbi:MAG: hypothetical protein ABIR37_00965 [Candidatus Saccharimonadales bacterium]